MALKWFGKKKEESDEPARRGREEEPEAAETATQEEVPRKRRFNFFRRGLEKTRSGLKSLFSLRRKIDEELIDEIETQLYEADFGPDMVTTLVDEGLRKAWKEKTIASSDEILPYLQTELKRILVAKPRDLNRAPSGPTVILVAGVNGSGKTTSIAKLSHRLKRLGNDVVLAAADTFRAAAVEQLEIWSQRSGVEMVRGADKADPASVAFKGAERAVERDADYLIVDTAGRLHTQVNLMRELEKVRRVISKPIPGAPHEVLLVLDATVGQNALAQVEHFDRAIGVTGIILAKLDGTAKGGVAVTVNNRIGTPVKFIGVGEGIEDLEVFDPEIFVEALFE